MARQPTLLNCNWGYDGGSEQTYPDMYKVVGFLDRYALGAQGASRNHIQVLNRKDACCLGEAEFARPGSGAPIKKAPPDTDMDFDAELVGKVAVTSATASLVPAGSAWKCVDSVNPSNFPVGWNGATYPDSNWKSGPAQLGYGDGDEATQITQTPTTIYLRKVFTAILPGSVRVLVETNSAISGGIRLCPLGEGGGRRGSGVEHGACARRPPAEYTRA